MEVSQDAERFETIAKIMGQGNSSGLTNYEYLDRHPFSGINYYRLNQVDFSGESSYSDVISVNNNAPPKLYFRAFPNPSKGRLNLFFGPGLSSENSSSQ